MLVLPVVVVVVVVGVVLPYETIMFHLTYVPQGHPGKHVGSLFFSAGTDGRARWQEWALKK